MEGLIGFALSAFIKALLSNIFGFLQTQQDNTNREALGASRVREQINKGAADAERRAAQAIHDTPNTDRLIVDLLGGKSL